MPPEMIREARPVITGPQAGHICRVLRLAAGDSVELIDGTGNGYRAIIVSASPKQVQLQIEKTFALLSESPVHITLAQGFLKERKMDDLLPPLTELGIHRWIPFFCSRSVPVPNRKGLSKRLERWEKIAIESVKQCRRAVIPEIRLAESFDEMLAESASADLKLIFWEDASKRFDWQNRPMQKPNTIMMAVGPEGGFQEDEIRRAREQGFVIAGLGPRILRAQTAALTAVAIVQHKFGDMGIDDAST